MSKESVERHMKLLSDISLDSEDWDLINEIHGVKYQKASDGFLLAFKGFNLDNRAGLEKLKALIACISADFTIDDILSKVQKEIQVG